MNNQDIIILNILEEVKSTRKCYGKIHSPHEGYAVLLEEVRELERAVFATFKTRKRMYNEALQVAAMAIRFIMDCCPEGREED